MNRISHIEVPVVGQLRGHESLFHVEGQKVYRYLSHAGPHSPIYLRDAAITKVDAYAIHLERGITATGVVAAEWAIVFCTEKSGVLWL